MAKWNIQISNFQGGFAPAWYKETYPTFGNKNQAGAMTNIDLTNPGYIQQGPGLSVLTNGSQAAAVTTLIKGALDFAVTSDTTYGTGGNQLYQFSSTAVANAGSWPHTIDKAAVTGELGEDVAYYQGNLYYSYNHSGSAGDIGKFDLSSTFDDDWGSTTPTGAAVLADAPHQMIVGLNDIMYFANGRYVGDYDGTTFDEQALDLPTGTEIQSIAWLNDRVWIAANSGSLTGNNKQQASIYIWDGAATSWETEIKLMGSVGALFSKNGTMFVWYKDLTSTGGYKLGYVNGAGITDVANFTGGLPAFYQVTDYKDFIIWDSAGSIFAFGSGDKDLPVKLFQLADTGYAGSGTTGCVVCPFGTPIIAANSSTNFQLAKFSGFDVTSSWKSLMFDITTMSKVSKIDMVRFNFETLATGASVAWKLLDNGGRTIYNDTISFAKLGAKTTAQYFLPGLNAENFRVELDYAAGDTTNTVKIKNIKIHGSAD